MVVEYAGCVRGTVVQEGDASKVKYFEEQISEILRKSLWVLSNLYAEPFYATLAFSNSLLSLLVSFYDTVI